MVLSKREQRILDKMGVSWEHELQFRTDPEFVAAVRKSLLYQAADLQVALEDFGQAFRIAYNDVMGAFARAFSRRS